MIVAVGSPLGVAAELTGAKKPRVVSWIASPAKGSGRLFAYLHADEGSWLVKYTESDDGALSTEHAALAEVEALLRETPLAGTTPVGARLARGLLVQPLIVGTSFRDVIHRGTASSRARARLTAAAESISGWLREFHRISASASGVGRTHGDFKPSNVLMGSRGVAGVVDWELSAAAGIQRHDLWHFLLYFGLSCWGSDRDAGFERTFVADTWVRAAVVRCLQTYGRDGGTNNREEFAAYVEARLALRAALGLSNPSYFLTRIQRRLVELRDSDFLPRQHRG